jgi:three-Cys-motif partner protein
LNYRQQNENKQGGAMSDAGIQTDEDGLPLGDIGRWAPEEKHARLRRYVEITSAARRKYLGGGKAGATYIDLYCGPGRALVRRTGERVDGSALVACKAATEKKAPFTEVHVGDTNPEYLQACITRLQRIEAPVQGYVGTALETVAKVTARLNPQGLHFAFLDPFDLKTLPFAVIERLAQLKRMDMLIHVSVMDLQRNLRSYFEDPESPFDTFAPGWRQAIDPVRPDAAVRRQIREYWQGLIQGLDMQPSRGIELVTGSKNQPLYWLVLVSRHPRAHELWEKIRDVGPQRRLGL